MPQAVVVTRLAVAASLLTVAAIAASAEPVRNFGQQSVIDSATPVVSAPSASARRVSALNRTMRRMGCDKPETVARMQACRQLQTRARLLSGDAGKAQPKSSRAARPAPPKAQAKLYGANASGQYRTMCVRLCDGFYFPVNEAARPANFAADEERCRSSCTAPAKLYYMTSSEDDAAQMTALDGSRYGDLPNAFRYRSEYVMQCDCKPKPWTQEARLIFDRRAVLAARSPLERQVAAGAEAMATLLAQGEVQVARAKARGTQATVRQADVSTPRAKGRRTTRYTGYLLAPPQSGGEAPRRRFFLFRW